jgi:HD-like signal output (HDOD) protein
VLAQHVDALEPGFAFASGLFLSIGRYGLASAAPAAYGVVRERARATGVALDDVEESWLGFAQARVGSALAAAWGLPDTLVKVLAQQSRIARIGDDFEPAQYAAVAAAVLARDLADVTFERAPPEAASREALAQHPAQRVLSLDDEVLGRLYEEVRAATYAIVGVFEG